MVFKFSSRIIICLRCSGLRHDNTVWQERRNGLENFTSGNHTFRIQFNSNSDHTLNHFGLPRRHASYVWSDLHQNWFFKNSQPKSDQVQYHDLYACHRWWNVLVKVPQEKMTCVQIVIYWTWSDLGWEFFKNQFWCKSDHT